ncbi:MAG TPA: LuxR C-terminal-related transcriptional regulator [Brevundimonas sp.]|nr:LuxR C-terminal-related transcriptional regulator [Brevundimonas sp.]
MADVHMQSIVLALSAGQKAEAIAAQGNQSLETVRTHIRRIYGKTQVGSREALFSCLRRFLV